MATEAAIKVEFGLVGWTPGSEPGTFGFCSQRVRQAQSFDSSGLGANTGHVVTQIATQDFGRHSRTSQPLGEYTQGELPLDYSPIHHAVNPCRCDSICYTIPKCEY